MLLPFEPHEISVDPQEPDLLTSVGWNDQEVEHRIAVAWDLIRPVALTERNLAMWVDGQRATEYAPLRPVDPTSLSLLLDTVYVGCGYVPDPEDNIPTEFGYQPNAIIREVELYTRHHPGIYTPTRLEMRTESQAQAQP